MAITKIEQSTVDKILDILSEAGIEGEVLQLNIQTNEVEFVTEDEVLNG